MARVARVKGFSADEVAIVPVMNPTVWHYFFPGDDSVTGKVHVHDLHATILHLMGFRFGFQIANHTLQFSTCSPEILGNSRVLLVTRIKPLGAAIEAIGKSSGPATPRNQHLEMSAD